MFIHRAGPAGRGWCQLPHCPYTCKDKLGVGTETFLGLPAGSHSEGQVSLARGRMEPLLLDWPGLHHSTPSPHGVEVSVHHQAGGGDSNW